MFIVLANRLETCCNRNNKSTKTQLYFPLVVPQPLFSLTALYSLTSPHIIRHEWLSHSSLPTKPQTAKPKTQTQILSLDIIERSYITKAYPKNLLSYHILTQHRERKKKKHELYLFGFHCFCRKGELKAMDSIPIVSFSTTKETPSSSSTGSLLIRAPLTVDSDNDYETGSSVGGSFENNSEFGGSEVDEFLSGDEEFETASERAFVGDTDDGIISLEEDNKGDVNVSYKIYVADKDDDVDSLENSIEDEEEGGGVDSGLVVGGSDSKQVIPIAQLSVDDEEFSEMLTDEEMVTEVEDGGFSGVVKVPAGVERIEAVPGVEEEEESLELIRSAVVNQPDSSTPVKEEVGNDGLENFVVKDIDPSLKGSQKDVLVEISKLDEEGLESKHGDDNEIEEKSSVVFNDPGHASQPAVVEPVDKVVVSDMKELMSDTDSFQFSSPISILDQKVIPEDITNHAAEKVIFSDEDVMQLIFGSSEPTKQVLNEVEHGLTSTSLLEVDSEDQLETARKQIVMESDEEMEAEREHEVQEPFDSAALAALLKAATGAESDDGGLTITSPSGSKVFSLERPAHSGSSFRSSNVAPPSNIVDVVSKANISDEERKRFEKLQLVRVKFLRLVQRLGHSPTDPMVAQVLYRLALVSGSLFSQEFTLQSAKSEAMQLEAEGNDDLHFSLNILVLGKTGVGKSASINSIFREQKSRIDAFEPATAAMKEIVGKVDGVNFRIFDTPGLRSPVTDEARNRKLLASIKKFVRKFPPDVVLYVDRLDAHDRDLTDLLILKSLTDSLGSSIWKNAIVALTHAASASPEDAYGKPLSFEVFVAQRSHVVHRAISQAVGDLRLMNPNMMHPVALVENNGRNGETLLPNGQNWRPQLLLLCYSVKILSEVSSLSKPQDPFDHQKLFGLLRPRAPPLPYLLSSLLQSRTHPKLPNDQRGDDVDLDIDLGDSTNSDEEDYDEYDQLPPFKPLRRSQVDKLSKEQRKAYFEEYDYRVKLLQKKQWREDVKRLREIKKKGKDGENNYSHVGHDEDVEEGDPATVSVPLPDMVLPPSFDGENPTYRYRFMDSASQFLMRPVLDSQAWDHDIGYDGVSLERSLAIAGYFPGAFSVQITKDKRDFSIHLDSSVCAKHGENGSTMAGFDIQTIGKQLAYIFRGETKFRNFKINQTTAGLSVTCLGENVATGLKVEDQIAVGERLVLAGSAGAMTSQGDTAYGANLEIRLKDKDFPMEQNQTTFGLSLVKWRRDLGLMANLQSQFLIGRSSSMAVRVGLNNKQSGQITLKVSNSEHLHIALASFLPIAASILQMIYPGKFSA